MSQEYTTQPSALDIQTFREQYKDQAVQVCSYWPVVRTFLELVKALPFVPTQVKQAIDWILHFGNGLCPSFQLGDSAGTKGLKIAPGPLAVKTTTIQVNKNENYIYPPVPAGDNGNMLRVRLAAPGTIVSVSYSCEGRACGWVYQCPDGGKCGGSYPNTYVKESDNVWSWYAWSNSGDNCVLIFRVDYE
jgi:hypothetical protein